MRNATQKIMRVNNALAKIRLNKHKTGGQQKNNNNMYDVGEEKTCICNR